MAIIIIFVTIITVIIIIIPIIMSPVLIMSDLFEKVKFGSGSKTMNYSQLLTAANALRMND